ncbi:hypothetical protein J5N97_024951 [Dioscorea zingiberensis]|uniref:Uncharacterized protein n=1 Tax=Dioscorea zingiberensis TaxID=325984 RepID=A0A9D5C7V1_9LILI|nr:hypothetical protein J5N97_024951 [Dioscorea zingiberensis]
MRSQLAKITLDKTFEEMDTLTENIVTRNPFSLGFGIVVYISHGAISPPHRVKAAIERRRALALESEGERQAIINIVYEKKNFVILASNAAMMDQVNRAKENLYPFADQRYGRRSDWNVLTVIFHKTWENKNLKGMARYASMNTHLGIGLGFPCNRANSDIESPVL